MKTFLLLAFSLSIVLAQGVKAEDQDKDKVKAAPKTRAHVQAPKYVAPQRVAPQHVAPQHVGPSQTNMSKVPHIKQTTMPVNQYHPRVQPTARVHTNTTISNAHVPRTPPTVQPNTSVQKKHWQNQNSQNTAVQKKNWQNQNSQNTAVQKKNWQKQNSQNIAVQKENWQHQNSQSIAVQKENWQNQNSQSNTAQRRNWQNQTVNNTSWEEARRRHHRHHHHRDWWRSHFTRFALFGTGYYFWDGGYWYPAYGYDSRYNAYAYDEPIYGYNDLDPGQVVASVQTELQRLGYYRYAVDGEMGPMTRAAIANYQRDRGLSITSAIDGPTLQSLGLD